MKKDIVEIFKKLFEMKVVFLIEGKVCKDHVHLHVSIPPKVAVYQFVGYLKGKSALMLFGSIRSIEKNGVIDTLWG